MKFRTLLLTIVALLGILQASADVAINKKNFPDQKFRDWLLEQSYGKDGVITDDEIAGITEINVGSIGIVSLKGIEFFTALKWLLCNNNWQTSLDVSKNTALVTLSCYGNDLTSLDVSGCTALTTLECNGNQLTTLNVSKNTALTELYCHENRLTWLDVSNNTALTELYCHDNRLTSLDVSNNTALTELYCHGNRLTSLDVSNNTALTTLNCNYNNLTSLDVSNNTALTELYCGSNLLTSLDVSNNTALKTLSCYDTQLTSLDVSNNTALKTLSCYGTQLTSLDVSKNTVLIKLECYVNQIKGSGMDALVESLPNVNYGVMYVIWDFDDIDEGNVMTYAQVAAAKEKGWTPYYTTDGKNWKKHAGSVVINEENFPDEKFRNYLLKESYGKDGVITDYEIAGIKRIGVSQSGIKSLKGIEFFTALKTLSCYGNQLTSLNVSKNTKLELLYCYNNQLTFLDLSKNTALISLHCYVNQIKGSGMDALVEGLPNVSNSSMNVIWYKNKNEGNVMTTTQVAAAKEKGWIPSYTTDGKIGKNTLAAWSLTRRISRMRNSVTCCLTVTLAVTV